MDFNLIEVLKQEFNASKISEIASNTGESESGISKAIGALIPTVLGGFANNSNNSTVIDAIKGGIGLGDGPVNTIEETSGSESIIQKVLSAIFGDKISNVVESVASYAGIGQGSSRNLLGTVTGSTLSQLESFATQNNLDSAGISSFLDKQKGLISALLPAGFSLGALGLGNVFGSQKDPEPSPVIDEPYRTQTPPIPVERNPERPVNPVEPREKESGGSIWTWIVLLLLIVAAYFIWKQCSSNNETEGNLTGTSDTIIEEDIIEDTMSMSTDPNTDLGTETRDIDLNGTVLKGRANGIEEQMITFLQSGDYEDADDDNLSEVWYNFDNVNFKMGSSTELESGSENQLNNIVTILKAFPTAKIKIGGYTDRTGSEDKNKEISQARADFIKKYLSDGGVSSQVIEAEGYGSEFATQPESASDDQRAIDRKMALRFTK